MKRLEKDSISTIQRDEVESDCSFLGVLNFLNAMREETPDVITQLTEGGVESARGDAGSRPPRNSPGYV